MAQTVAEIMNPELFTVREHDRADDVLHYLQALGITGAPVTGRNERAVGFVALRDLIGASGSIEHAMHSPCDTVPQTMRLAEAARVMGERGRHHLVCVDDDGRPVGFLSALDLVRGLTDQPVPHPRTFPHWDPDAGVAWSNEARLELDAVREHAPEGPGMFVLIQPRHAAPNQVVWSEASSDVQTRLRTMLTDPDTAPPQLASRVELKQLWFRAARAPSAHALTAKKK